MATIRKLRGRWQAMVRRKGMPQRCKSFDVRADAERWSRELENQIDRGAGHHDRRPAENMTLHDVLSRYLIEITPTKRSALVVAATCFLSLTPLEQHISLPWTSIEN